MQKSLINSPETICLYKICRKLYQTFRNPLETPSENLHRIKEGGVNHIVYGGHHGPLGAGGGLNADAYITHVYDYLADKLQDHPTYGLKSLNNTVVISIFSSIPFCNPKTPNATPTLKRAETLLDFLASTDGRAEGDDLREQKY